MADRASKMLKAMPKEQREEVEDQVKELKGSQLTDILKNVDLGALERSAVHFVVKLLEDNVLPKLQQSNPAIAVLIATLLDSLEKAVG